MQKIGIFFGSSLGNTKFVAEKLHDLIPNSNLVAVEKASKDDIESFDFLILGVSTWGVGNLQDDFETFVDTLLTANFEGKTVAMFGLGDQFTYPDTFCNGMGQLYRLLQDKPCEFVGAWPSDDYDFSESMALVDGNFVGLALDEDNEPDLTDHRLAVWSQQILSAL